MTTKSPARNLLREAYAFFVAKRVAIAAALAFWTAISVFLVASGFGRMVEYQFAHRLEFVVRDALGHSPVLDPRIKIFGYDDKSIAAFKSPEISLADWTSIIHGLSERKPRTILIDKIFGFIPQSEQTDLNKFVAELTLQKKAVLGAFLHTHVIPLRPTLDVERPEFMLDEFMKGEGDNLQWLPIQNMQVYGPQEEIAKAASHIGQILYPGFGSIAPWIRVSTSRAIPHLGLSVANEVRLTAKGTLVDGTLLPTDRFGLVNVNFTSPELFYKKASSMRSLIARARAKEAMADVNEGDVVILLPLMYTGNFDVMETPLGRVPAGFVHASIANSILREQWLNPLGNPYAAVVLLVLIGVLVGGMMESLRFWAAFAGVLGVTVGGSVAAFSFGGIVFPWLFPTLGFVGAALTMHGVAVYELHERSRRLNDALNGLVPRQKLSELIAGTSQLTRDPCERVVTVMFLDIANFSAAAQERTPKEVFFHLKSIMNRVTATVHKYGGTVDRTLGDGLLCFFGYSYDGNTNENHADAALACASEIQKANVIKCIEDGSGTNPILPFRIGINTASAFIGDLGNPDRIDFTLIGNGVNLAQRLESASDHHSIMISLTTFDLSTKYNDKSAGVSRRKIKIKHHDELVDCVEIDPLIETPEKRQEAVKILRQRLALNRGEQRWPITGAVPMRFVSKFGTASLVDFSRSGLCVALPTYLARSVQLAIEIVTDDPAIAIELKGEGLQKFRAEVRWGRPKDGAFIHGIQFLDLNEAQQIAFLEIMRKHCVHEKVNVSEIRQAS